jgi:hypothetical protein
LNSGNSKISRTYSKKSKRSSDSKRNLSETKTRSRCGSQRKSPRKIRRRTNSPIVKVIGQRKHYSMYQSPNIYSK